MRCESCPVSPAIRCDGRLCGLAGSPDWDRHIRGRAEECQLRGIEPPAGPRPDPEALRRDLAILARIGSCPDRTPTPGCGCSGTATCARDGQVKTRDACWSCVATA